jgi:hypothetical protein
MDARKNSDHALTASIACFPYEAPRIEMVMTAEDLEREVMLAIVGSGGGN